MLLGWIPESICNYSSCLHGGGGDGDVNKEQGHIQLVSESGMRTSMCITTVEQSKEH